MIQKRVMKGKAWISLNGWLRHLPIISFNRFCQSTITEPPSSSLTFVLQENLSFYLSWVSLSLPRFAFGSSSGKQASVQKDNWFMELLQWNYYNESPADPAHRTLLHSVRFTHYNQNCPGSVFEFLHYRRFTTMRKKEKYTRRHTLLSVNNSGSFIHPPL